MKKQMLQVLGVLSVMLAVGMSLASITYAELSGQPRSTVFGPSILKVGEVGQFTPVEADGSVPYAGVRDSSSSFKGVMLVDGGADPIFADECDGNEYTIAVSFDKPGRTEIWCKYIDGQKGDMVKQVVMVIPEDADYPDDYGHGSDHGYVVGLDTLEVGEVGVYMTIDTNGDQIYTSNQDAQKLRSGIMQVAPDMEWTERTDRIILANYVSFHDDPDNNTYTMAVSFNETGVFQVRCKYMDDANGSGDMAHKIVYVVPKGHFALGQ
jgi:hypothetical protein